MEPNHYMLVFRRIKTDSAIREVRTLHATPTRKQATEYAARYLPGFKYMGQMRVSEQCVNELRVIG